jgi:hypothetical protein
MIYLDYIDKQFSAPYTDTVRLKIQDLRHTVHTRQQVYFCLISLLPTRKNIMPSAFAQIKLWFTKLLSFELFADKVLSNGDIADNYAISDLLKSA